MTLVTGLAVALLIAAGCAWLGGILRERDARTAPQLRDASSSDVSRPFKNSNKPADPAMSWTAVDDRQFRRLADDQRPDHSL